MVQAAAGATDRVGLMVGEGGSDLGAGRVHAGSRDPGRDARLVRNACSSRGRLLRRSTSASTRRRLSDDAEARRAASTRCQGPVVTRTDVYR